ncbi:Laccase-5 [Platanthera guangdongensis]|uniref:Laccase-5 n=1 Tax=Platanthera guangdongensis TaxID=2320717 RepID=A0ABR2M9M6_9ASPA
MNNISFVLPTKQSLLQAANYGQSDVFSADFQEIPPAKFDYTGNNSDPSLSRPIRGTKIYRLKYGSVVQVVLQGTSILSVEEHPIHIHGYDFYVLAMGKGNYEEERDSAKFNLVDRRGEARWGFRRGDGRRSDSGQIIPACGSCTAIWTFISNGE